MDRFYYRIVNQRKKCSRGLETHMEHICRHNVYSEPPNEITFRTKAFIFLVIEGLLPWVLNSDHCEPATPCRWSHWITDPCGGFCVYVREKECFTIGLGSVAIQNGNSTSFYALANRNLFVEYGAAFGLYSLSLVCTITGTRTRDWSQNFRCHLIRYNIHMLGRCSCSVRRSGNEWL